MKVATLNFAANEEHMLYGLLAIMFKSSEATPDKGQAWVIIGQKIKRADSLYSEDEVTLLKLAVESTIAAGARMLEAIPIENVPARLKAGVIKHTYEAIQEKISNAEFTIYQEPQDLRGDDKERATTEGDNLPLAGRGEETSGSGAGSGE